MIHDALTQQARAIRLLTCDVDGVLTDGRIFVDDDGRETKAFNSLDGIGLKMLINAGIAVAWITGSRAPAVLHRARALGVERVSAPNCNARRRPARTSATTSPMCRSSFAAGSPLRFRTRRRSCVRARTW